MTPYALYNEIDEYAADWLENLIKAGVIAPGIVDRRSIEDLRGDDLRGFRQVHFFAGIGVWSYALRRAGISDDTPLWTGSCPCQPFSAAGKGGGVDDERHLWPALLHLIRERRPVRFLGEQVASKDGLGWLDLVSSDLEAEGYAVGALDTCSAGSGAPHIRQRLRIYAYDRRPAAVGLEYLSGDGWIERRTESGRWRSAGGRGIDRMDDDDDARLEGFGLGHRAALGHGPGTVRPVAAAGEPGGVADSNRLGEKCESRNAPEAAGLSQTECQPEHDADLSERGGDDRYRRRHLRGDGLFGEPNRPGPTNGFWRDADWLFCRDGKWRPVESGYVEMVDGTSSSVGSSSAPREDREGFIARMSALFDTFGAETISEWAGGSWSVSEQEVLRSHLHGELDGRPNEGRGCEEQPQAVGEDGCSGVRDLRALGHEAISPSSGRESDEQRPLELTDVVRLLPQSLSLAELWGRRRDADQLRLLQRAIRKERGVLHASEPLEAAWTSLGEEAQGRIRLAFDAGAWRRVVSFPLVDGSVFKLGSGHPYFEGKSRQGMLKGYGNAIDAEATIDFIEACLQYRSGRAVAACSVDLSDLLS